MLHVEIRTTVMFKPCCYTCGDIDVISDSIYSGVAKVLTIISCAHACVCGRYAADTPLKKTGSDLTGPNRMGPGQKRKLRAHMRK